VTLADQDTGVVDGLGKTELVDAGLETALQKVLNLEGKHVIELHAGLVEHTNTDKTANERVTLEEALGVLLVESKERTARMVSIAACAIGGWCYLPGSTTDLGEGQLDAPDLALVAQTILADELQLGVPTETLTNVPDVSGASSRSVAMGVYVQTSRLEGTTGDAVRLGVAGGDHCGWFVVERKSAMRRKSSCSVARTDQQDR
jgi:hypothetical protein